MKTPFKTIRAVPLPGITRLGLLGITMPALILAALIPVNAADIHITPTSNLQNTLSALQPGDTLWLGADAQGHADYYPPASPYNDDYTNLTLEGKHGDPQNGNPAKWTTIKPEPNVRPILHEVADTNEGNPLVNDRVFFSIWNSSFIRIEGLEMVGWNGDIRTGINFANVNGGGDHDIQIINNYVHDFGGAGIGLGDSSQVLVEGNIVSGNCKVEADAPSGIDFFHPVLVSSDNSHFATDNSELGNPGNQYALIIRNNTCYDNILTRGQLTDGNGIICDDFEHAQSDGVMFGGSSQRTLVANNVCYYNGGVGVHVYESDYVDVFNNTCYGNQRNAGYGEIDNVAAATEKHTSYAGKNNRFYDNICYPLTDRGAGPHGYVGGSASGAGGLDAWDYNLYWENGQLSLTTASGAHDINRDPKFVSIANTDFHLSSASAAIGTGMGLYQISYDRDGNPRGGVWDVGAYAATNPVHTSQVPATVHANSGAPNEQGMKFSSDIAGKITAIRFWRDSQEAGSHTGRLWSASGQLLASVTFKDETPSGWQQANLAAPVSIAASTTYVVSVNSVSRYAVTSNGLAARLSNSHLTAPAGGGVSGSTGQIPTSIQNADYFRDVIFMH